MSDLCRQCSAWTDDSWAICVDCRKQGYYNLRENSIMNSTRKSTPPIKCIPCRINIDGIKYRIYADGSVSGVLRGGQAEELGLRSALEILAYEKDNLPRLDPHHPKAREIRREASRLRRNRNARERHQALRSLGMTKTPYGWE